MMPCKFKALDQAILDHIRRGFGHPTNSSNLEAIAQRTIDTHHLRATIPWRLIDRRISELKKAGKIVLGAKRDRGSRWSLAGEES